MIEIKQELFLRRSDDGQPIGVALLAVIDHMIAQSHTPLERKHMALPLGIAIGQMGAFFKMLGNGLKELLAVGLYLYGGKRLGIDGTLIEDNITLFVGNKGVKAWREC